MDNPDIQIYVLAEENRTTNSYVIEFCSDNREGKNKAVVLDEVIAWATEKQFVLWLRLVGFSHLLGILVWFQPQGCEVEFKFLGGVGSKCCFEVFILFYLSFVGCEVVYCSFSFFRCYLCLDYVNIWLQVRTDHKILLETCLAMLLILRFLNYSTNMFRNETERPFRVHLPSYIPQA